MAKSAREEQARDEGIAARYLIERKQWRPSDFRLEYKGMDAEGKSAIIWAIFLEDERRPVPGSGKSLELHVDRYRHQVIREIGFQ